MSFDQKSLMVQKYHSLLADVSVGFETSFACECRVLVPTHHVSFLPRQKVDEMIHTDTGATQSFSRVYNPAFRMQDGDTRLFYFVPLVDEKNMLFHRVCLRQRKGRGTGEFQKMVFARFGEEEKGVFWFPERDDARFLTLDYLGKTERFLPLFIKTIEGGEVKYWCLSMRHVVDPEVGVLSVVVDLEPTIEAYVPEHLQEYEFCSQK